MFGADFDFCILSRWCQLIFLLHMTAVTVGLKVLAVIVVCILVKGVIEVCFHPWSRSWVKTIFRFVTRRRWPHGTVAVPLPPPLARALRKSCPKGFTLTESGWLTIAGGDLTKIGLTAGGFEVTRLDCGEHALACVSAAAGEERRRDMGAALICPTHIEGGHFVPNVVVMHAAVHCPELTLGIRVRCEPRRDAGLCRIAPVDELRRPLPGWAFSGPGRQCYTGCPQELNEWASLQRVDCPGEAELVVCLSEARSRRPIMHVIIPVNHPPGAQASVMSASCPLCYHPVINLHPEHREDCGRPLAAAPAPPPPPPPPQQQQQQQQEWECTEYANVPFTRIPNDVLCLVVYELLRLQRVQEALRRQVQENDELRRRVFDLRRRLSGRRGLTSKKCH
eukprot:TRINITY_DN9273_c1_g1_i1.p1 TRINITY_DN9273_c1_g1~~TRINITY_DN9273_c1_g1_i1.p1  ORF type:complete len:393 (+),score=107.00 TRINITY_DN9273_c1_g1_i1:94-1272(+)